jgi:putative membrane protein
LSSLPKSSLPKSSLPKSSLAKDFLILMNRRITWVFFTLLLARYVLQWARLATGWPLPSFGNIGFTLVFAGFSLAHAIDLLGWRRAVTFFGLSALISWCFEEAGVATGLVYGAYHYGDKLGPKLGAVPAIIPLAWFMMIYCAWIVAHVLLDGTSSARSWSGMAARALVAAMAITAWDVVMDPGMARAGNWTWENGGSYFGVPVQNYIGWVLTTLSVYLCSGVVFRILAGQPETKRPRLYTALPVLAYSLVAVDHLVSNTVPELRVVAAFGIALIALIALLRLASMPQPAFDLP